MNEHFVARYQHEQHVVLFKTYARQQFENALFVDVVEFDQVGAHEVAFHNHGHGNAGGFGFHVHVGGRERFVARFRHNRHSAVGFHNRVFHLSRIEIAVSAQGFQQVVYRHIELFEDVGQNVAFFDDDDGLAVEHLSETHALDGKFCHYDVHEEKREHGNYSVNYRNRRVAHGNTGKLACHQGYCKFEGLQFSQLALTH